MTDRISAQILDSVHPARDLQQAVYDSLLVAIEADLVGASHEEIDEALAVLVKLSRSIAKRLEEELQDYGLDHTRFLELIHDSDRALADNETLSKSPGVNRAAKELWFRGMDTEMIATLLGLEHHAVKTLTDTYSAAGRQAVRLHVTSDLTLAEIADEIGMGVSWTRKLITSVGETPRAAVLKPVSPKERSRMVDLRLAGKTYREISETVRLPLEKVKNVLKHEGRKGRIPGYQGQVAS